MQPRIILDSKKLALTIDRLTHQLIENHGDFEDTCIIGVQPRGVALSDRIVQRLRQKGKELQYGRLDATFYRDDFRRRDKPIVASKTDIDFPIEDKNVVLIDDVLFTGRTIRSAMDALLDLGRPRKVELLVLIDRRYSRHLPVQPDYVGKTVDAVASELVRVEWEESGGGKVWILSETNKRT